MKLAVVGLLSLISTVFSQTRETERACGIYQPLELTATQGNIYSPGYLENKKYPANSRCSYVINVPRTRNLLLELKNIDIEASDNCVNDYVQVIDAQENLLMGKFCGSNITQKWLVDSNVVRIEFASDIIVGGRGFHIAYQWTTQNTLCQPREVSCKNYKCVPASAVCNLKDDCGDGTDEANCRQKLNQKAECGIPRIPPVFDAKDRIVGGQIAVPGSWPWQADLQIIAFHPNGHQCGGTLINSQWVVTAAHCFLQYETAEPWRIHLGNHHKFKKDSTEQIRYPSAIYFYNSKSPRDLMNEYQNWQHELLDHDIALIKLNAEVEFTSHVSPICLPPAGFEIPVGTKCITTGWGMTRASGGSDVLKQTTVTVIGINKCASPFQPVTDKTMICTDDHDSNGGVCHGDSGGPFACEINKKWYLVGITSFGTDLSLSGGLCGIGNVPNVYQKVSSKIAWIQSVVNRYS